MEIQNKTGDPITIEPDEVIDVSGKGHFQGRNPMHRYEINEIVGRNK